MDNLKKVTDKETILNPRYTRFKGDWGIYLQDSFKLKNAKGQEIKEAHHININDPTTLVDRVVSVLSAAEPRPEVYIDGARIHDDYSSRIELLWKAVLYDNDVRLGRKLMLPLHRANSAYASIFGWIVDRATVYEKDGRVIFDILPCDPQYVSFEVGDEWFEWVAYRMVRSKALIEQQYGVVVSGKEGKVVDFWDGRVNEIYIDAKKVDERENKFGKPPFSIQSVGLMPEIGRDAEEATKNYGESLYSANRKMWDYKNEIASIAMSIAHLEYRPPTAIKSEGGLKEFEESPFEEAATSSLDVTEGFEKIPIGLADKAALFLWGIIDPASQRGGLAYTEWGTIPFELSNLAIESLREGRDQIFIPRIKALVAVYRDVAHMLFDQFIELNRPAKMGDRGNRVTFKPSEFMRDFSIRFGITTVQPERDITSWSVAAGAERLFDDETILREIIKVDNPTEVMAKKREQELERAIPELAIFKALQAKKKEHNETEDEEEREAIKFTIDLLETKLLQLATPPPEATPGAIPAPKAGESPIVPPSAMMGKEMMPMERLKRKAIGREAGPERQGMERMGR